MYLSPWQELQYASFIYFAEQYQLRGEKKYLKSMASIIENINKSWSGDSQDTQDTSEINYGNLHKLTKLQCILLSIVNSSETI